MTLSPRALKLCSRPPLRYAKLHGRLLELEALRFAITGSRVVCLEKDLSLELFLIFIIWVREGVIGFKGFLFRGEGLRVFLGDCKRVQLP